MSYTMWDFAYCQSSDIRGTIEGNRIIDHSDVIGALPVSVAVNQLPIFVWRFMES